MAGGLDTIELNDDLKLLITCCQVERSDAETGFILNYLSKKDEDQLLNLISLSTRHGILPLVYKAIKKISTQDENTVPATFLTELKAHYMSISQRNMLMSAELIRIMKLLEDNGIEALAFKGPTLSQMAYGDITLRQYSDLDILVSEKNIYRVAQLMVNQNYEPMNSIEFLNNSAKLHVEKNYEFYGRKNGIKVEIHWRLINTSFLKKFKNHDVFSKHDTVSINNKPLPTLDTRILLLYLCNHGASHMWERLEWIVDIDRIIKSKGDSWDWDEILKLASTLQSKTTLLLGIGLSKKLFNTKLPPQIERQIHKQSIFTLISFILTTLNSDLIHQDHTSHKKNYKVFQFNLTLQDSLSTQTGFIIHTLFGYSDRDVMMVNLPKSLYFLYYPLRIIRIIKKYIFRK